MEILLLPKGAATPSQAVAQSNAAEGTLEQIFFQIPETGEYEIWVRQFDQESNLPTGQDYALAWWYGTAPPIPKPGDYDKNGSVGPEDYIVWRSNFGSQSSLDADGNGNGTVDTADYVVWRNRISSGVGTTTTVPEPRVWITMCIAFVAMASKLRSNG